ncbi:MAG: alcohol dehydrogenase catalytic domain-containing protein [Alphaproteobacteria bacterium]|nr:alcohol dehydrogenase catalytic domain-containing protein [Alphaproteobacteria bacterium]
MKAVIAEGSGPPEVLVLRDIPTPVPAGRQVLVRVRACGVCRRDVLTRQAAQRRGAASPLVLGHEIAGEVAALGPDARRFAVGDRVCSTQRERVCGCCTMCRTDRETLCADLRFLGFEAAGGYAEYALVNDDNLARVPASVDFPAAAIVACTVGTSYNAVCDTGRARPGETVLIVGMGGLGSHAVQIAHAMGTRVIAATRSPGKEGALRQAGADVVVVTADGRFAEGVRQATAGRGVDMAVDTVGGATFHEVRRSMAPGGRIVVVGEVTGTPVELDIAAIYRRGLEIRSAVSTSRRQLEMALRMVESGAVRPLVERIMPLEQAAEAHRLVEANAVTGRVVLVP